MGCFTKGWAAVFKADKTVTVIRCTTDGATDQTSYTCRAFAGCSWYSDHAARAERNGTAPSSTVKVRIPADSIQAAEPGWTPQPGDLLVLGAAAVETEAELSALRKQSQTARVKACHAAFPYRSGCAANAPKHNDVDVRARI